MAAVKLFNNVGFQTATTGTGSVAVGAALDNHQLPAAAGAIDGDPVRYYIKDANGAFESGEGAYSSAGPTLSRDTVLESSDAGAKISVSGDAEVYFSLAAEDVVQPDAAVFNGSIQEAVHALSGTSPALDPANGTVQTHTLSGNTTYSDSLSAGEAITLMIDDGSAYTVTWPTMTWVNNGGSAPTLATTGYTVVALWKVGTTLHGALIGDGS